MENDLFGINNDFERGFQYINVCIERDDDGSCSWKTSEGPSFWETMNEDRQKTAEEKLAEAEFVECEIIEGFRCRCCLIRNQGGRPWSKASCK